MRFGVQLPTFSVCSRVLHSEWRRRCQVGRRKRRGAACRSAFCWALRGFPLLEGVPRFAADVAVCTSPRHGAARNPDDTTFPSSSTMAYLFYTGCSCARRHRVDAKLPPSTADAAGTRLQMTVLRWTRRSATLGTPALGCRPWAGPRSASHRAPWFRPRATVIDCVCVFATEHLPAQPAKRPLVLQLHRFFYGESGLQKSVDVEPLSGVKVVGALSKGTTRFGVAAAEAR